MGFSLSLNRDVAVTKVHPPITPAKAGPRTALDVISALDSCLPLLCQILLRGAGRKRLQDGQPAPFLSNCGGRPRPPPSPRRRPGSTGSVVIRFVHVALHPRPPPSPRRRPGSTGSVVIRFVHVALHPRPVPSRSTRQPGGRWIPASAGMTVEEAIGVPLPRHLDLLRVRSLLWGESDKVVLRRNDGGGSDRRAPPTPPRPPPCPEPPLGRI